MTTRQLRVAEESRFTHIKFLLNGAGDDSVMIHDKQGMKTRATLITGMDVWAEGGREV